MPLNYTIVKSEPSYTTASTTAMMASPARQPILREDKTTFKHTTSPPQGRSRLIRLVKKAIIIYGLVFAVIGVIGFNIVIVPAVKDAFIAPKLGDRVISGILAPIFFGFELALLYVWLDIQERQH